MSNVHLWRYIRESHQISVILGLERSKWLGSILGMVELWEWQVAGLGSVDAEMAFFSSHLVAPHTKGGLGEFGTLS